MNEHFREESRESVVLRKEVRFVLKRSKKEGTNRVNYRHRSEGRER